MFTNVFAVNWDIHFSKGRCLSPLQVKKAAHPALKSFEFAAHKKAPDEGGSAGSVSHSLKESRIKNNCSQL